MGVGQVSAGLFLERFCDAKTNTTMGRPATLSAARVKRRVMCGNVTILGRLTKKEARAFPARARLLLESMLSVSQIRGSQSGGGAVQLARGGRVQQRIGKCVNTKRGDLATKMTKVIAKSVGAAYAHERTFLIQAHVRFATSGVSTRHEAHPFCFVDAATHGPRRVMRWRDGQVTVDAQPVETTLTHNGDMDGLNWRGRKLYYPDLGYFLEHVLGVPNRWVGDSPQLAAALELFVTRGMWFESLRLAYHVTVAPQAPDLAAIPSSVRGPERKRAIRALLAEYVVPSRSTLTRWAQAAEAATLKLAESWAEATGSQSAASTQARNALVDELIGSRETGIFEEVPERRLRGFLLAAVNAFFDNDLYVALRKLEPALLGTFGCVVTSTLEPGTLVVLSRGQPLSLGFQRREGTVGVASERAALKVRNESDELAFEERLDLDLCRGEIARVGMPAGGPIHLTLYRISDGRELTPGNLQEAGRVVSLQDNPYIAPLPSRSSDRIKNDLETLESVLRSIRASWKDATSYNRRTAVEFSTALLRRMRPTLLLLGVTNDLWLAEQFASNLRLVFPHISVDAVSSNQVLREPDSVKVDADTVVLAVSQSGQDFPTLGAMLVLGQRMGSNGDDSIFVLTGEVDCLMGQAVGQQYAKGARFSNRIFVNHSGFRPTEAAITTVSATHHSLCRLLMFLAEQALDTKTFPTPPYGCSLRPEDLEHLQQRASSSVDHHAPLLTGTGDDTLGSLRRELIGQARRWRWHIAEGAFGFLVLVAALELNLQLGWGVVPSTLVDAALTSLPEPPNWLESSFNVLGGQLDVAFYAFLIPLSVWVIRSLQRRATFHRHGLRELLIGDTTYVHRIAWLFARKLFSLSYGFASVKPYSANCQDELIMTHEPVRGTLVLIGLPDARRASLRTRANAALMSAKQFDSSRSFATTGAEIVTIGHTLAGTDNNLSGHIALPSTEVEYSSPLYDALCEGSFDSWERLLAMQIFLDRIARSIASLGPARYDRSRTKDQVFAPTTAAPVSAAAIYQLLSRADERYEQFQHLSLPFDVKRSSWRSAGPGVSTTVWDSAAMQIEHDE